MSATRADIADILAAESLAEAEAVEWTRGLIKDAKKGTTRALLANALHALRNCPAWRDVLRFNEFALVVEAAKPTPWGYTGTWGDRQDVLLAEWLQRGGIHVGAETAGQAVQAVSGECPFHPVRAWLKALEWDCTPRLDSWLTRYLGVEDSPYASAVGRCSLIGGVARAVKPGSKVDSMMILEGPQGLGKSRASAILGGAWFADEIADLGSKDAALQLAGTWLMELSELDAMGRAEAARVKAFLSRSVDHFRPPYGKRVIDAPRSCWFIGTTNSSTYLKDETGARRFWPVRCGRIDHEGLARDRDQLFAEARVLYEAGAEWWLKDADVIRDATGEQAQRFDADPWQEGIAAWVEGREHVTVADILKSRGKDEAQWTQIDKNRVCRVMQSLGWTYTRRRWGVDGSRVYVFVPPETTQ